MLARSKEKKEGSMKIAVCLIALCYAAMAQESTLHGVTITGIAAPTITNSASNPAILGLVYQTLATNMNPINHTVEADRIVSGNLLGPGESVTWMMANNMSPRGMKLDSAGKVTVVSRGDVLGYKLLAVLFANGKFYTQATARDMGAWKVDEKGKPVLDASGNGVFADDSVVQARLLERVSTDISTMRSIGQMLSGLDPAHRATTLSLLRLPNKQASVSEFQSGRSQNIADALSRLANEDERSAGIARLVALPDVAKGE